MAPGRTARASLPPSDICYDIMAIVCAVVIPLAVPVAAVVGAVAKTTQKLPLEQAFELNQVTAAVGRPLNLTDSFTAAMVAEARRRGITLTAANPGAEIFIDPQHLSWDIRTGNKVAITMEIDITVQRGGEQDSSDLTYRSDAAQVEYWIADDGRPIRQSLDEVMTGASRAVWDRVLGEE